MLAAKAIDISYDFERVYITGRLLTSVRPVFDDPREEIIGWTVVQTLRLEFVAANGDQSSISIAMDADDIRQLKKECDVALVKAEKARAEMESKLRVDAIITGRRSRMSYAASGRRRTGAEMAIPHRKGLFVAFADFEDQLYLSPYSRKERMYVEYTTSHIRPNSNHGAAGYPKWLVRVFTIGVVVGGVEIILWLASLLLSNETLKVVGSVFFTFGSVAAVLALLRGQDLNGRAG